MGWPRERKVSVSSRSTTNRTRKNRPWRRRAKRGTERRCKVSSAAAQRADGADWRFNESASVRVDALGGAVSQATGGADHLAYGLGRVAQRIRRQMGVSLGVSGVCMAQ
jgi:hypothetical protein